MLCPADTNEKGTTSTEKQILKKFQKGIAFSKIVCYNIKRLINRGVVQSVEHQSPKLGVQGSSPCAPAKKIDKFRLGDFFIQAAGLVCNHASACMVSP